MLVLIPLSVGHSEPEAVIAGAASLDAFTSTCQERINVGQIASLAVVRRSKTQVRNTLVWIAMMILGTLLSQFLLDRGK